MLVPIFTNCLGRTPQGSRDMGLNWVQASRVPSCRRTSTRVEGASVMIPAVPRTAHRRMASRSFTVQIWTGSPQSAARSMGAAGHRGDARTAPAPGARRPAARGRGS